MRLARSILAGIFFAGFALGSLQLAFLLFPILAVFGSGVRVQRQMRALVRGTYRLFVSAAGVTGLFRVDISPEDRALLAKTRGCVVVANHLTLIDIIILLSLLGDATAIAKAAAARNPFYARIVRAVFLVNDDPEKVLSATTRLLQAGCSIVVFPEGTRTPAHAPVHKLRRGAAQVALAAHVPIVPVQLTCTPPVLGKGQPWYDVGAGQLVYALRVQPRIPMPTTATNRHAAAVALTTRIHQALFTRQ